MIFYPSDKRDIISSTSIMFVYILLALILSVSMVASLYIVAKSSVEVSVSRTPNYFNANFRFGRTEVKADRSDWERCTIPRTTVKSSL